MLRRQCAITASGHTMSTVRTAGIARTAATRR
jgi:hypothetical protein